MENAVPRMYPNVNGLVEKTLDVSQMIELTKHALSGEAVRKVPHKTILDNKEQIIFVEEWVQVAHPFMTIEGVETVAGILQLLANHVTMGSNLPVEKAAELAFNTDVSISTILAKNSFKWRIDISKLRIMSETLRNLVYSLTYRSVDGWLLDKLTSMTSRIEDTSPVQPTPSKGIGMLNPLRLFK